MQALKFLQSRYCAMHWDVCCLGQSLILLYSVAI